MTPIKQKVTKPAAPARPATPSREPWAVPDTTPSGLSRAVPPEDWYLNSDPNFIQIDNRMEVRFPSGDIYRVIRASSEGALLASIEDWSRRLLISLYARVEIRRAKIRVPAHLSILRHVDATAPGMVGSGEIEGLEYNDPTIEDLRGGHRMPTVKKKGKGPRLAGPPPVGGDRPKRGRGGGRKVKGVAPILECLCGCGGTTRKYFVPGHDARFKGWLSKIEKGVATPEEVMPKTLVKALGPWGKKGDGQVPAKSYTDLRDLEAPLQTKEEESGG